MKKFAILAAGTALLMSAIPVLAKGPSAPAGKSNMAHLYLYEKNPSDWSIVAGGAWGKMSYNLSGPTFNFVFNGHGLDSGDDYTLIYYPDPWPGNSLICFGSDTANTGGVVHIMGSVETNTDLPASYDAKPLGGAKIWLVLSNDVDCNNKMVGWNPTDYLFEHDVITFDDTDL